MTDISRTQLPIPRRQQVGLTTYDAKDPDTSFPPIEAVRPPAGAPNVLVVMIDDAGFGASSVFGGPCNTPNAQRLADHGLRFNRFHTTALCSPTRQALLTGRNHHAVGMGGITEIATSAPGYDSVRPDTAAAIAESCDSTGSPPPRSASATRSPCGRRTPWGCLPSGPPAAASSISTGS